MTSSLLVVPLNLVLRHGISRLFQKLSWIWNSLPGRAMNPSACHSEFLVGRPARDTKGAEPEFLWCSIRFFWVTCSLIFWQSSRKVKIRKITIMMKTIQAAYAIVLRLWWTMSESFIFSPPWNFWPCIGRKKHVLNLSSKGLSTRATFVIITYLCKKS